ncbi:GNAT family N-acetyltransferase [Thermomonospora umbrina]|uniref:Acetyltransferase (GNAT) family protein n=1 Tax=Thermomonospora umbrina TaxID=111806 RepID=A0A3D9SMC1_9ACTN|nr:GNAT family N-acetyltransferase [Thermomonospora umbrina]REE97069.1 acetyltransferase (GNAT) family protein [Thermomonospora umbrina]
MTLLIEEPVSPALVRVRPYGITDAPRLRRMSDLMSAHSLYSRFFTGTPRIPEMYVRRLDDFDHWDREALVALAGDAMVGVAEYVRDPVDPARADLGVMVADPWRRLGMARMLVTSLADTASRRGIGAFTADVLPDNAPAISALRQGWPLVRPRPADGMVAFTLPLPPSLAS